MTTTLEHPPVRSTKQQPQAQAVTGVLDIDARDRKSVV